jgi:RHS repeat-associated protein
VASATYDADNRLSNWAGTALTYDANGNLTKDGTATNLTWNERDQLTGISAATVYGFKYDAVGRRQAKTVGGVTTSFLYDGENLIQELNGIAPLANYLTGLGIDETYQRTDSTGAKTFLTDALGSTLGLTDTLGNITTQYKYEPYGKTTQLGTADANPIQYTGRENDGSGYYYYRARYYSPKYQRFVAEDPIGIAGGVNLYEYVKGSPTNAMDPMGLEGLPNNCTTFTFTAAVPFCTPCPCFGSSPTTVTISYCVPFVQVKPATPCHCPPWARDYPNIPPYNGIDPTNAKN